MHLRSAFSGIRSEMGMQLHSFSDMPPEYCVATRSPISRVPAEQQRRKVRDGLDAHDCTESSDAEEHETPPAADSTLVGHQRLLSRLPIPPLEDTCTRLLKSLEPIASSSYEYFVISKLVDEFKASGGVGQKLDALLRQWDVECGQPSWLEEFWDDAYLCPRDPLPINLNYFFGFSAHPNAGAMTQNGRAAGLLFGAVSYHMDVRNAALKCEYERENPVCMSQNRFLCCTSRLPGRQRDRKLCYCNVPALTVDELSSKSVEYVSLACPPRHCVVIRRNHYFSLDVLHDDCTLVDVETLVVALQLIEMAVEDLDEAGPPVGVLTTMDRTRWFEAREHLKQLGNYTTLQVIQSAIICLALDSIEVVTSDEAARVFLHGSGTNRWFDRHNIIVTRDGWAGVNWEHSVADGTAALRMADRMYRSDCSHEFTEEAITALMEDSSRCAHAAARITDLEWKLDTEMNRTMKQAFDDYKAMIEVNEMEVLRFRRFGANRLKGINASPDAFVQLAFQLTYYRMFGCTCATYEAASTRTFLHGRTECVRSATKTALDFCIAASEPIFSKRVVSSIVPTPLTLMREAMAEHVCNMKLAKRGHGFDRHLLGLRLQAVKHDIPLPKMFEDPVFRRSAHWVMSTSHCGGSSLSLFGFGPVVGDGFGIGYMIKDGHIDVCITSKYTHSYTSARIFARVLESSLLHMLCIAESESITHERTGTRTPLVAHPTGFNDFRYTAENGFAYESFRRQHHRWCAAGSM